MRIYDLLILGAGPAGITASIYAVRKHIDFLVITQDIGGQAAVSYDIENYTGYQFITGPELAVKFQQHMESFNIPVHMPESVVGIALQAESLIKTTTNKAEYFSKALIIATGKRSRQLNIEGEKEFKNRGLTYCAICDGPLFKDKAVAVVGAGNSGLDAVLQLMKISPRVYLINRTDTVTADPIVFAKTQENPTVKVWNNTVVKRIFGETFVTGIEVEQKGVRQALAVEGVFVEIGLIPNSEFARAVKQNEFGEIVVDCYNRTDQEGVFAAGDVTSVPEKQIIIACGEGSKACLAAVNYLSRRPA